MKHDIEKHKETHSNVIQIHYTYYKIHVKA